jgi:hypothetical protein
LRGLQRGAETRESIDGISSSKSEKFLNRKQLNLDFVIGVGKFFCMITKSPTTKTVFGKLTQPLSGLVQNCNYKRKCNLLTDQQWIETGLFRILSQEPSGRAFLQKLFDSGRSVLKHSHFFETLKGKTERARLRDALNLFNFRRNEKGIKA